MQAALFPKKLNSISRYLEEEENFMNYNEVILLL
jgi:hypothetical protein